MKTFLRNLAFGLIIGLPLLIIVASAAAPAQTQQAIVAVSTTVNPVPTPTPTDVPTPVPPPPPVVPPAVTPPVPSPEPVAFPTNPPALVVPTAGAQPTPVPQPQTMVTISVSPCTGDNFDVNSGGCKGTAPFVVTYTANWQCYNSPACTNPTFKWSNGDTGQTIQVTYSSPGNYQIDVKVTSVYNGVTYQAGSANSVPVSVS